MNRISAIWPFRTRVVRLPTFGIIGSLLIASTWPISLLAGPKTEPAVKPEEATATTGPKRTKAEKLGDYRVSAVLDVDANPKNVMLMVMLSGYDPEHPVRFKELTIIASDAKGKAFSLKILGDRDSESKLMEISGAGGTTGYGMYAIENAAIDEVRTLRVEGFDDKAQFELK